MELDPRAAMEMVKVSGQRGVPVITVDGEVVVGFDQARLTQVLSRARPKLGASVADAASQARVRPGLPSSGAYVGNVRPASVAERAGLRAGDVIIAIAGEPVRDATHLHQLLRNIPKQRDVSLAYVRDHERRETSVRF